MRRPLIDVVTISLTVPRGEDGFWDIIRELDKAGGWTIGQVADRTNVAIQLVRRYVLKLRRGGYLEIIDVRACRAGPALPRANVYRLVRHPVQAPRLASDGSPLPETANDSLWRAMKMLRSFTVDDLAEACRPVSRSYAKQYCNALANAGIAIKRGDAYSLTRNLGGRAPRILATRMVYDPNAKVVVGSSVAREVRP